MRAQRMALAAVCALCSLALVPGLAQAQSGRLGGRSLSLASPLLIKHKGGKTYEYCGSKIGCTGEFVVYSKTHTFEFTDETPVSESGTFETKKEGKKKVSIFITTSEYDNGCITVGVKTKTGWDSEAEPGTFECPGFPEAFETWYAIK